VTSETGSLEIVTEGIGFPEGLRYRDGEVWFSDYVSRSVLSLDSSGTLVRRAFVPGQPSGLGFLPDGDVLVVSMFDRYLVRIGPDGARVHAELANAIVGMPNDLLVDGEGRAYVGATGFDFYGGHQAPVPTPLILVEMDGSSRPVTDGLLGANGMRLTPDGGVLVVVESFAGRLTAFDVSGSGELSNKRTFADLGGRMPDGMCLDSSGAAWVGCVESGFVRFADGGEVLEEIEAPGRWAIDCALGGEDLRTLYCGTSRTDLERHLSGQDEGAIEAVTVSTPGF